MSASGTWNARRDAGHQTQIAAASFAYPSDVVDNAEYQRRCRFTPTSDWAALAAESGIVTRRWCQQQENTATLTAQAVAQLIEREPELCSQIDVVVVASGTTMPMAHPSDPKNRSFADLSPLVLRQLGHTRGLGLDIKACYCTGFVRGMQVVDGLLANPNYRAALLVTAEQGSRFALAETNRSAFCFIVSDAAGAVVFRRAPRDATPGILDVCGYTDVEKLDWVGIGEDAASIVMLGSRAGSATQDMLVECAELLMRRNDLDPQAIDWLIPVQTHRGLLGEVTRRLDWPEHKLLWFADRYGFSGSASIPTCLAEQLASGRIKKGQRVLSLAVGAGMNCGGALYQL